MSPEVLDHVIEGDIVARLQKKSEEEINTIKGLPHLSDEEKEELIKSRKDRLDWSLKTIRGSWRDKAPKNNGAGDN